MGESEVVTQNVRVRVKSRYVQEHSQPEQNHWFFVYTIRIVNEGEASVQLLRRRWVITDGNGGVEEVEGAGVVGEQPVLQPGEGFEYTSACPLRTPVGSMHGAYAMLTASGDPFDAEIAPFALFEPGSVN